MGDDIAKLGGDELKKSISEHHVKNGDLAEFKADITDASTNMLCKKIIHVNLSSLKSNNDLKRVYIFFNFNFLN